MHFSSPIPLSTAKAIALFLMGLFGMTSTSHAQFPIDQLVAYFPMDSNGNDLVGGLVPLVTEGSPTPTADRFGRPGKALRFDGNDFYSYGDVLNMDTSSFSISLWAKVESYTNTGGNGEIIISSGTTIYGSPRYNAYSLGVVDTDSLKTSFVVGDDMENLHVIDGYMDYQEWFHLTATRKGQEIRIYINGVVASVDSIPPNTTIGNNIVFAIGALDRNPTGQPDVGFFDGCIDDILIYQDRCLTEAEIQELACPTPASPSTDVLGPQRARLQWFGTETEVGFQVEGGPSGGSARRFTTIDTSRTLNILSPGTAYQWRVRAWCGSNFSDWSEVTAFSTPLAKQTLQQEMDLQVQLLGANQLIVQVPEGSYRNMQVFDALGRSLDRQRVNRQQRLSTHTLSKGWHMVVLEGPSGRIQKAVFLP